MAAALSVTHGFLPPHPAPTAITSALGANAGHVLLYGVIIAIPSVYVLQGHSLPKWHVK